MIKGVTYDKPSSTQWINESYDKTDDGIPDLVPISKDTGNAIYKDEQQGNVKLNEGQKAILGRFVDKDTLEYTAEENRNAGANQIDTKGEDGEDLSEKNEDGGATAGAIGAGAGALSGIIGAIIAFTEGVEKNDPQKVKSNLAMFILSLVCAAGAATCLLFSLPNLFDPNLKERETQTSESDGNIEIIDGYSDEMSNNIDSMNEDYTTYQDMAKKELTNQTNTRGEIAALRIEIETLNSQGLDASAPQAELDKLLEGSEEPSEEAEEMSALKEYIEYYASRNAEAQGVKSSGDTVAEFLQDGEHMKKIANTAAILATVGVVAALAAVIKGGAIVAKSDNAPTTVWMKAAFGVPALAIFAASAVVMGTAAGMMFANAKKEGDAEDAGDSMASSLSTLNGGIESQSGVAEETTAGYGEMDKNAATRLGEVQEGLDESVNNTIDGLNDKPDDEEEE